MPHDLWNFEFFDLLNLQFPALTLTTLYFSISEYHKFGTTVAVQLLFPLSEGRCEKKRIRFTSPCLSVFPFKYQINFTTSWVCAISMFVLKTEVPAPTEIEGARQTPVLMISEQETGLGG